MKDENVPDGKMVCQVCGGHGEYVESYLYNDGVPGKPTRIESETVECSCDNGLIDDPEADE